MIIIERNQARYTNNKERQRGHQEHCSKKTRVKTGNAIDRYSNVKSQEKHINQERTTDAKGQIVITAL